MKNIKNKKENDCSQDSSDIGASLWECREPSTRATWIQHQMKDIGFVKNGFVIVCPEFFNLFSTSDDERY